MFCCVLVVFFVVYFWILFVRCVDFCLLVGLWFINFFDSYCISVYLSCFCLFICFRLFLFVCCISSFFLFVCVVVWVLLLFVHILSFSFRLLRFVCVLCLCECVFCLCVFICVSFWYCLFVFRIFCHFHVFPLMMLFCVCVRVSDFSYVVFLLCSPYVFFFSFCCF